MAPTTAARPYRGRFAPSPTGPLHFGSLVAAFGSWLIARQAGGKWLVRVEDIDPPREVAGAITQQLATLDAFGLKSDEPILRQSERGDAYLDALEGLLASGEAFACHCTRSHLADQYGIHRRCVSTKTCSSPAIRLRVADRCVIGFDDAIRGRQQHNVSDQVGDFVLRRADGLWAYQLAVVVDDAAQGITDIVRGADLLESTSRQILLQQRLGVATPHYAHLPVVTDEHARKLGKSHASSAIDAANPLPALRKAWRTLGQRDTVLDHMDDRDALLETAIAGFDAARIPVHNVTLPEVGPSAGG